MGQITCDVADHTARTARHYLGLRDATTRRAEWAQPICTHITDHDIATSQTTI